MRKLNHYYYVIVVHLLGQLLQSLGVGLGHGRDGRDLGMNCWGAPVRERVKQLRREPCLPRISALPDCSRLRRRSPGASSRPGDLRGRPYPPGRTKSFFSFLLRKSELIFLCC